MKFKKLVILPLSAMLIGCGGGYSTNTEIPAGGETVVIDPSDTKTMEAAAADVKTVLYGALSTPVIQGVGGYTMNLYLDAEFGMKLQEFSMSPEDPEATSFEEYTWGDFTVKGDVALSLQAFSNDYKVLRVKASNLSVGVKVTGTAITHNPESKESFAIFNGSFKNLNFSIDYVYNQGSSNFYVDLSDASIAQIPTKIRKEVLSGAESSDYSSKEEKQMAIAQINAVFDRIDQLVVTYGKSYFSASDIVSLIDEFIKGEDVPEIITVIKTLLDGNLITNAATYFSNLLSEKASQIEQYLYLGSAFIATKKETTIKDYSTDTVTSYGFSTSFNKDEISAVASLISQGSVEFEKASLGLAAVASTDNPFADMRLSLLDVRADLKVENTFYFQGEVKLTLSYEELVPLTPAEIAEYKSGMELVQEIKSLVPNGTAI